MPRAGVHARRDLDALRSGLGAVGVVVDQAFARALLLRHRAIDANDTEEDARLHFMRGYGEEDAAEAIKRALGHARDRAWRAAERLVAARDGGDEARQALVRAMADALHVVRDSYSSGHARRQPRGWGPVVALRAWAIDRLPGRAFGLRHALKHDLRFEYPFALWAREVPASDAAVRHLVEVIVDAALAPPAKRPAAFEAGWRTFVAERFLPPGRRAPRNEEDLPPAPAGA